MSLVTVFKVSLTFIERKVFHEIGLQVEPGNRIGLVGPNGSGKTTLLRLIMGEISPDSGEVRVAKGIRVRYLPQDVQESLSGHLLQSVLDSVPGIVQLKNELINVEKSLRVADHEEKQLRLSKRLAEIHQQLNHSESEFPNHDAEKILLGLGFDTSDFERPVSALSGGFRMRAALASRLFQKPDLLLLDEPTNHLDIPSVRWLEQFLHAFKGAMILVSHDRDFLNRQIRRIISFEPEGMRSYSGNYDFYLKAREEETKGLEAKARHQEQKVKEAEKFIERFRSKASKARQAQSKIKLVKKMDMVQTRRKEKIIRFSFPEVSRSGRDVVSFEGMSKGFGQGPLYRDVNLTVRRGEKIAIIGPNGCGKTTLLRMVAGEMEQDEGKISLGYGVSIGYFAQHHSEMLMPQKTVIDEVYQVVPHETVGFVRNVCSAFLFSGEDVDKVIGVLSGGERARVSLAKLLVKPGNMMVMDEPTNHLDISSSETLIDALEKYNGTLLFVSHNQSFINRLATKIWDIRGREIIEYPGNLDEYYDHLERIKVRQDTIEKNSKSVPQKGLTKNHDSAPKESGQSRNRKAQKREQAEKRRLIHDTLKPILTELEDLEQRIAGLESTQKEIEKMLADPEIFRDKDRSVPLLNEYSHVRKELDQLLSDWEKCQGELESTKKGLGV
ncbi:MAG: ABC-F family ATP-binding cassette domain-containing protein [Desulfobacterales bacterium]|nr:ABC-F family ATP-binding cassette domain-containing protein [Desulfobacterales bacterium]